MPRFSELAKMKLDDVKRPPLCPPGTYIFRITKPFSVSAKDTPKGSFEFVDFPCQAQQAEADVDQVALHEAGGVSALVISKRFIFNTSEEERAQAERTNDDLKQFLQGSCQVEGSTIGELCANAQGAYFKAVIGHRPDPENIDRVYYDMKQTMPLD